MHTTLVLAEKKTHPERVYHRTSEVVTGGPVAPLLCPQHQGPVQVLRLVPGPCAPVQSWPTWEQIQAFEFSSDR